MKKGKKIIAGALASMMLIGSFAGCSGSSAAASAAPAGSQAGNSKPAKTVKFLSMWAEDTDNSKLILGLTKKYQEEVNPNFKVDFEFVPDTDLRSKVQVLLSSNDLPDAFAYESGAPLLDLIKADAVLNVEDTYKKLGIYDQLEPAAVSLLKSLVNNKGLYCTPLGLNVEGIWYNKALFAKAGISEPPKTWDDLEADCAKLQAKGIQPFTEGGKDKWPLTRILNMYVFRSLGNTAVQDATAGKTKFTDAGFVKAAQVISDMAKKKYFGTGVITVDQNTSCSMLINGQAAMFYNGSWYTENLNNKDQNAAGEDGIGFFNVPVVNPSVSAATDYSMNCGTVLCFSKKKYDAAEADWMKYMFSHFGDYAMSETGSFKGYKINNMPKDMKPYTKIVSQELGKAKGSTLWFEASFDSKTSSQAQDNIQALFNGEMTAEQYMGALEKSAAQARK